MSAQNSAAARASRGWRARPLKKIESQGGGRSASQRVGVCDADALAAHSSDPSPRSAEVDPGGRVV